MRRIFRLATMGARFRFEARATAEGWRVNIFRNDRLVDDFPAPSEDLDDKALVDAFARMQIAANAGAFEPDPLPEPSRDGNDEA